MHDVDHTSLHRSDATGIRRVSELYRTSLKLKHLVPFVLGIDFDLHI
jgi:hypothetical protein